MAKVLLQPIGSKLETFASPEDARVNAELTTYQVQTSDEIVVASSSGGRTSFQNASATRRRGIELSALWRFSEQWSVRGVGNWLDARYSAGYSSWTVNQLH